MDYTRVLSRYNDVAVVCNPYVIYYNKLYTIDMLNRLYFHFDVEIIDIMRELLSTERKDIELEHIFWNTWIME